MPAFIHSLIQANLLFELRTCYGKELRLLSELSLDTAPVGTTPDLAIYPLFAPDYDNRPARQSQPPLGCIEIQSQSQSLEEMVAKVKIYFQFGVRSCWVVQPAVQGIFVFEDPKRYSFFHADDTLRDTVLGLELPLAPVFA
ncbi:MAG: Uma2 family endonuclease [Hymenobacter sp.]|nr:MAG: Uma2 family endonuclease [Hymenobacter sp.]